MVAKIVYSLTSIEAPGVREQRLSSPRRTAPRRTASLQSLQCERKSETNFKSFGRMKAERSASGAVFNSSVASFHCVISNELTLSPDAN